MNGNSATEEEASHIACYLLKTLCHMKKKNVIHRDLKPENIMVVLKQKKPQIGEEKE